MIAEKPSPGLARATGGPLSGKRRVARFTDQQVIRISPEGKRFIGWGPHGLGLRVTPNRTKTWVHAFHFDGIVQPSPGSHSRPTRTSSSVAWRGRVLRRISRTFGRRLVLSRRPSREGRGPPGSAETSWISGNGLPSSRRRGGLGGLPVAQAVFRSQLGVINPARGRLRLQLGSENRARAVLRLRFGSKNLTRPKL